MSTFNAKPAPKGGLTPRQERALFPILVGCLTLGFVILMPFFPEQTLFHAYLGAMPALVPFGSAFRWLRRPVALRQLIRFIIAVELVAWVAMAGTAGAIHATGWTGPQWLETIAGFGASFLIVWPVSQWLFRVMIERHDDPTEGEDPA